MAHIWVLLPEPTMHDVEDDAALVIGRGSTCHIRLKDARASKAHAQVRATDEGFVVEDLGSSNGTFIEGQRVRSARLIPGVRFRIGDTSLVLDDRLLIDDLDSVSNSSSGASQCHVVGLHSESSRFETNASPAADSTESLLEQKLRLIQHVGELLIQIAQPEQLAEKVLEILVHELRADRGFLCLFDETLNDHYPLASHGLNPGEPMRISRTLLRRMHEEQSGVLLLNYGSDGEMIESLLKMSVESTMGAPLWTGNRIVGFLSLDTRTSGHMFSQSHLELLMAVAMQVAVGIECGRQARRAANEEAQRNLLCRFLNNEVINQVLHKSNSAAFLEPVEREVTVLCAGLVEFPSLQHVLEPAETVKFMQDYLTSLTETIYAFGGAIDKYIGTTIVAIFGAPVMRSEFERVAVQAALQIRESIGDLKTPVEQQLRIKIGISTGTAIVGNIGSTQRVEFTTLGDPVTIASQLLAKALPNEICVDQNTLDKVNAYFAHKKVGIVELPETGSEVHASVIVSETGDEVA